MDQFVVWFKGQEENDDPENDFDELLKDAKRLQFAFIQFLESYRVVDKGSKTKELIRPKANTLQKMKSMLRSELSRLSGKFEI